MWFVTAAGRRESRVEPADVGRRAAGRAAVARGPRSPGGGGGGGGPRRSPSRPLMLGAYFLGAPGD
jgi:hypothetical protein